MIHIAAACDEAYAMPLAVMLASLNGSLAPDRLATVHILESGLRPETRAAVEQSISHRGIMLHWVGIAEQRLQALCRTVRSFDHVSPAAYYRLLLPELAPPDVRRLIYLDCDLVIQRDLGELWETEMKGAVLLAAPELAARAQFVSSPEGIYRHRDVGLKDDQLQFNSGVMLINLDAWREERIATRAFAYLSAAAANLRWHDQEALNVVTADRWAPLDPRWNVTMHVFHGAADALQARDLIADPYIVHYNTAHKPWQADYPFGFGDLFQHHLDQTSWAGERPTTIPLHLRIVKRLIRLARKRWSTLGRLWRARSQMRPRASTIQFTVLDQLPQQCGEEIRVFVVSDIGATTLAAMERHLARGADRVIVACSSEEAKMLPASAPIHRLTISEGTDLSWHDMVVALLDEYGCGHWCVVLRGNETLGSGFSPDLCAALSAEGTEALLGRTDGQADLSRLLIYVADPRTGRAMEAPAFVADSDQADAVDVRSRIVLLKYRDDLVMGQDLIAVRDIKLSSQTAAIGRESL